MSILEFALIISAVVALYNIQQIKMILKEKGYQVEVIKGTLKDYRLLKSLIEKETEESVKIKYQKIINGLHLSLAGLVVIAILMLKDRI